MTRFDVLLTADAERDLDELYGFIAEKDSQRNALHVLDRIEKTLDGLCALPERGSHPQELLALGIRDYRQVFFKPYRMIYRVVGRRVYVYVIADGRRDVRTLLERRLFGA